MGLRPLSLMVSSVHDEPRTIPRVDAALDQLRSLQRPNPHQPVLLDTRGSTARVAHLEETVATPEIKPRDEEFDEIGQDPVRHLLRPFAFTNSSKRAGTASGRGVRGAAVDAFIPTTRGSWATRSPLTEGNGAAAVYDGVGKSTFEASLASPAIR